MINKTEPYVTPKLLLSKQLTGLPVHTYDDDKSHGSYSITPLETELIGLSLANAMGRLKYTQVMDKEQRLTTKEIVASFFAWKDRECLLVFKNKDTIKLVPAIKRGKKNYAERIKQKWNDFEVIDTRPFFNPKERGIKTTKMLHLTLTNKSRDGVRESWLSVGKRYNLFLSNLKKNFGKLVQARCWESFESGYPHIHAVVFFEEHDFNVFKDSNGRFRTREKNDIAKHWDAFVDVEACYDTNVLFYLSKHTIKFCQSVGRKSDKKQIITLAYCWIYQKRSFSISKNFYDRVHLYGLYYSNLNDPAKVHKSELTNGFEFVGLAFVDKCDLVGLDSGKTHSYSLKSVPVRISHLIRQAESWSMLRAERKDNPIRMHNIFKQG